MAEYQNALFNPKIRKGYSAADLAGTPLGLQSSPIAGGDVAFRELLAQMGKAGAMQGSGGVDESGREVGGMFYLDPSSLAGYDFNFTHNGGFGNSGTLSATGPDGKTYSVNQQDTPMAQSALEAAALAAAGFGGVGLLTGLGPLGGLQGMMLGQGGGMMGPPIEAAGGMMGPPIEAAGMASPFSYAPVGQEAGFSFLNAGAPAAGDAGMAAAMDAAGSWATPEALAAWGQSAGIGVPEMAASGAGLFGLSGDTLKNIGNFANLASPLISAGVDMYSANKAAGATNAATTQANDLLKYMYDTTRQDNMPGLQARNDALGKIQGLLSNPQSITGDPGYQFGLNQGTKAFENSAAARGMTYSGQQAKALTQFGQDYAGSKMDQSVNRLLQLANAGSGSAANIANAGSNYAGTAANNITSQGTANALLAGANGNAVGNALNQLTAYGNSKKWWQG